jgi:hypothetical protein
MSYCQANTTFTIIQEVCMSTASLSILSFPADCLGVLQLSAHAEVRIQQRGVERDLLECLLEYGARQYDHKGCEVVFLTEASLNAIARHESHYLWARMKADRNLYAVVNANGCVVTAGHRYRRVQRDTSLSSLRPGRSRKPRRLHSQPVWHQLN